MESCHTRARRRNYDSEEGKHQREQEPGRLSSTVEQCLKLRCSLSLSPSPLVETDGQPSYTHQAQRVEYPLSSMSSIGPPLNTLRIDLIYLMQLHFATCGLQFLSCFLTFTALIWHLPMGEYFLLIKKTGLHDNIAKSQSWHVWLFLKQFFFAIFKIVARVWPPSGWCSQLYIQTMVLRLLKVGKEDGKVNLFPHHQLFWICDSISTDGSSCPRGSLINL